MGKYRLDGITLDEGNGQFYVDNTTGVRVLPARRTNGLSLPGRDGMTPSSMPGFEPGMLALSIIVKGSTHQVFMANLEYLYGILGQRKLLELAHLHDSGGEPRYLDVEVMSSAEPEMLNHRTARVRVILSAPYTFWRDAATVDSTLALTASPVTGVLTAHAGTTATVPDSVIRVKGAISAAALTDVLTGDTLTITAALTATEYLIIDTTKWVTRKVTSDTWNGYGAGSSDVSSVVESSRGSGNMLPLHPDFSGGAGRLRLTVSATNPASSPTVAVRARRSFL